MTARTRRWMLVASAVVVWLTVACSTTIAGSAVKAPGEASSDRKSVV